MNALLRSLFRRQRTGDDATAALLRRLVPGIRRPAFYAMLASAALGRPDSDARARAAELLTAYDTCDWPRLRAIAAFDPTDDDYVVYAVREYDRVRVALAFEPYDLWSPRRLDDLRELTPALVDALFRSLDASAWKPL